MPHMNNVDIDAMGSCNRKPSYEMPNGTSLILANSFPVILQASDRLLSCAAYMVNRVLYLAVPSHAYRKEKIQQ